MPNITEIHEEIHAQSRLVVGVEGEAQKGLLLRRLKDPACHRSFGGGEQVVVGIVPVAALSQ